jgi:hypothetical protein
VTVDPADFAERCRTTNARIEAGEPMTIEQIADAIGIPYETFAEAMALEIVRQLPDSVVFVDNSPVRHDA